MLIGFGAPISGAWAGPANLRRIGRRAEELGYSSLWTMSRLLSPEDNSMGEQYREVRDPVVALAYLAGQTERIRLGVAVLNAPFFAPVLLAKQVASLDEVSGGRLDLGLGAGWSDDEYAAVGLPKNHRGRRIEEYLRVLDVLFADDVVEYSGEFYHVPRSRADPKPVQRPRPPILLGGTAAPALRRAGRVAEGWVSSSRVDPATIGTSIDVVRGAAAEAGRDPNSLRFVCRGVVRLGPGGVSNRRPLTGDFAEIRADLRELERQGVTEVFVDLNFDPEVSSPDADPATALSRAEEVLEALAPANR
ncbi:TIGR03619 family F420-dependent LLM class oxidoreductase [Tamaricihabitans halophyticus]|uniref:TIGR03619 family F420-dependent LLM class oxidoreductase n=1 Tax=Tamaricihabitans halophyticus TaxID=1262583 RepID=UPI001048E2B1|nr:TIGR03619 family F420-dependent LLM class oxidoreductase [Tamaricihabitans halophyticus]